ncbi:MAG: hypothetical protein LUK37_07000 [Clostridia bacterium]|nr:hypothetical protein [Clostridia bacterium]
MPDVSVEGVKQAIDNIKTEREMVIMFAAVENKAWWIKDKGYDFVDSTQRRFRCRRNCKFVVFLANTLRFTWDKVSEIIVFHINGSYMGKATQYEAGQYCNNGYSYVVEETCNNERAENLLLQRMLECIK